MGQRRAFAPELKQEICRQLVGGEKRLAQSPGQTAASEVRQTGFEPATDRLEDGCSQKRPFLLARSDVERNYPPKLLDTGPKADSLTKPPFSQAVGHLPPT
jgi:hypothetical protein